MELLPNDVIQHILEKLPGKSLLKFKSVSPSWKSIIESRYFRERQLIHRRDHPDVLLVHRTRNDDDEYDDEDVVSSPGIQMLESSSSSSSSLVTLTTVSLTRENLFLTFVSRTSCDGLVCVYGVLQSNIVVNPTTRWSRSFPFSSFQLLVRKLTIGRIIDIGYNFPGFGRDKFNGTYKPVCLYNSSELELENATTCEVFDFSTNAWRFLVPASPHRIILFCDPLYFDGSLLWFTDCEETQVLSLDLHSETFQVISKAPFADHVVKPQDMVMLGLNNRLCVSEKKQVEQVIWSFDSGNKTWAKLYSIDLNITCSWFGMKFALSALPLPGKKKTFLLYDRVDYEDKERLVLHDPQTSSYDLVRTDKSIGCPLFPNLDCVSLSFLVCIDEYCNDYEFMMFQYS